MSLPSLRRVVPRELGLLTQADCSPYANVRHRLLRLAHMLSPVLIVIWMDANAYGL